VSNLTELPPPHSCTAAAEKNKRNPHHTGNQTTGHYRSGYCAFPILILSGGMCFHIKGSRPKPTYQQLIHIIHLPAVYSYSAVFPAVHSLISSLFISFTYQQFIHIRAPGQSQLTSNFVTCFSVGGWGGRGAVGSPSPCRQEDKMHASRDAIFMGLARTVYIYTLYMTVYLVISLPKIPYVHRIHMVLANPRFVA
jgi:hypothetical protein